ncbi:PREDICTED: protein-S-isoprenylcysteine O-methyltransferase [Condylura cristata]|uniref:protein-S-isoprenylcysteine O-methyltransferase n=1 Tax=Condylura cristata TaxID=143302 RepID=UPI00064304F9|nr:PREDICTED: protein-S-isoprenylcysteine O-methyltransferase [Condylura cristata]
MCSLSLFHYSEYLVTAVNNPKSLSLDSFLLNHSLEYTVAALSSWVEFTLENIFWPELKQITWLSAAGLLMVVFGECLRKAAMFTAGSNFNHVVQNEKSETHTLVTSGVYAWFRHPSYVGWFYWSIGTQVQSQVRRGRCPAFAQLGVDLCWAQRERSPRAGQALGRPAGEKAFREGDPGPAPSPAWLRRSRPPFRAYAPPSAEWGNATYLTGVAKTQDNVGHF